MKAFRASGTFRAGNRNQEFTVDVVANSEEDARERIFSNFGSRHRAPRRFINIDSLSEIAPTESTSPTVVAHFADQ